MPIIPHPVLGEINTNKKFTCECGCCEQVQADNDEWIELALSNKHYLTEHDVFIVSKSHCFFYTVIAESDNLCMIRKGGDYGKKENLTTIESKESWRAQ